MNMVLLIFIGVLPVTWKDLNKEFQDTGPSRKPQDMVAECCMPDGGIRV
jgi:hypothetical protein